VALDLSPESVYLADHLIFRNDWKTSEQFRRLLAVPELTSRLTHAFEGDRSELVVELPDLSRIDELAVDRTPGIALDTQIYANRVYVASTEGLYEWYFHPEEPIQESPMVQHLDFRVSGVRAGYASVNASAEDRGLWFQRISFGDEDTRFNNQPMISRIGDESFGASFTSCHLLNYTEDPIPSFLRARTKRERPHDRAIYESTQVESYESEQSIAQLTFDALIATRTQRDDPLFEIPRSGLTVLGNSAHRLLAHWQERLHVVNLSAYERKPVAARPNKKFGKLTSRVGPEEVLSTYGIGQGFLVELYDRLLLITPTGSYTLFVGSAGRVRTYPGSRRHFEVVVVVGESSVNIIGYLEVDRSSR
jgi:hypothetical protein